MAFIEIEHPDPDVAGTARVTENAFIRLWEGRGWVRKGGTPLEPEPGEDPAGLAPPDPSALKADHVAYAVSRGMNQTEAEAMTKADLIAAYAADGTN